MIPVHDPLHCFLPPHILKRLEEQGTPEQQERAARTLAASREIRDLRRLIAGNLALAHTITAEGKERIVYTAAQTSNLPGTAVRREGDLATGDAAVDEAYDGAGATYDLFHDEYNRNSIDDRGMRLDSTVHYLKGYDNAFWNGQQMVYGDGDEDLPEPERLFNRFTIAQDIIGHELTHGVTQYAAALIYQDQPGALNESMSDVFGVLVKQRTLSQEASQADWIVGKGLFTSNIQGEGIRSMKAPGTAYDDPLLGKDPQPAHMLDYVQTHEDNGGVHINSGIPNHAFYLAAVEMGGYAWQKAGNIWYITLRDRLQPNSDFQTAANHTFTVAGELYGKESLEQQAVRNAWAGVGLNVQDAPSTQPTGCVTSFLGVLQSMIRRLGG